VTAPRLGLSPRQFAAAFPFHLVLDERLCVLQVGAVLRRLCPQLTKGEPLDAQFTVQRPVLRRLDLDAIRQHGKSLFVLQHREGPLRLRGEMVQQGRRLFFLGSPWVTQMEDLTRLELSLRDFAVHDPVTDLLLLLRAQHKALADAQRLSTRLKQQQDSLREATLAAQVAEHASRMKSQFMAVISHEIRTPLNGVLGMLEYLLAGELAPQQRACAATALKSSKTLLGILNDILDFSKVEAGKLALAHIDFSLRRTVADAIEMVALQASEKGLAINFELSPGVPEVLRGDPARIRQVLVNFLANAVKFTAQGAVGVRVVLMDECASHARVRVEVEDSGIGIPPDKQQALFEPFSQADASTTREYSGTGLGLAICRKLASLMGGEVGLRSEPGRGSTFWMQVPLEKGSAPASPQPPAPGSRQRFAGHLLLGEDDPVNQLVAQLHLTALGLTVDVVDNGRAAVEAVQRTHYDLVLLDLCMPGMDGLQACQAIRARHGAELPIVIWTASLQGADQQRFLTDGANAVLCKPFEPEMLRHTLATFLDDPHSAAMADFAPTRH
jgi:signal transduction histidine kinase/ActR/RegA family two-component response regulator